MAMADIVYCGVRFRYEDAQEALLHLRSGDIKSAKRTLRTKLRFRSFILLMAESCDLYSMQKACQERNLEAHREARREFMIHWHKHDKIKKVRNDE